MFEVTAGHIPVTGVSENEFTSVASARAISSVRTGGNIASVFYIGLTLCVFQAMDGLLTAVGISRYGRQIEGNPLLRSMMGTYGHGFTLTCTKLFAIAIVILLTVIALRIPWVKKALGALTCIYFFGAIVPWTYILFIHPYI